MAVLEQIRKNTKLTLLLVGGAILAFVATDALQYCNPKSATNPKDDLFLGSISGVDISDGLIRSYNNTYEELNQYLSFVKRGQGGQSDGPGNMQSFTLGLTQRYQDIKNDVSSSEGYTSQEIDSVMRSLAEQLNTYMENVNSYGNDFHVDPKSFFMKKSWDDFINLHVLSEKAKDIGIKIPNNQIKSLESRGQAQGQAQVSDFAEEILLANTYLKLLEKGSYSNHIDSTLIARSQNTSIRYVKVPYTLINDIDVTQQEIEDYYQTNIDDYQSDIQTKELEYILLNVSSSEKDEQLAYEYLLKKKKDIIKGKRRFNERVFTYKRVEKINAEYLEVIKQENGSYIHQDSIMGPYKSSKDYFKIASLSDVMYESEIAEINYLRFKIDTNLTDSVANRRANIFKQQVSNGEDFKSLSEQTANDTNIISGNISDFSRDNNIQLNFSEMALDSIMIAKQGRVLIIDNVYDNDVYVVEVEKVMSQFPTFLIYVDSSRISVSKETDSIVRNKAEDVLSKMSDEENISLRDIAETGDLYYNNISGIDVTTFNLSPVLRDCRDVVNWMFDESRKVGDLSEDYFECDRNRKLLIVRLLSVNDAGDIPLDEVRSEIKEIISANKQYDRLEDLLSNQRSLEGINRIFPETQILERKNLNMSESNLFNGVIGAANSSSLGEMSKPIKGDDALYFISVLDKTPIDNNQYQDIISQQDQDKRLDINDYQQNLFTKSLLQSILIDKSIVDNRHLIED